MIKKPTYEELEQRIQELEQAEFKRKTADRALREREELFRLAFHTSPDAINLNRVSDGLYIDINDGFTNIMGYTREDVIGKTSLSLNIWKDSEDRKRLIDGLKRTGYIVNFEAQFVGKDGKIRVGLMSARVLRINDENVILSITRDITDRKQDEEALKESQERYRNLFELSPDGIVIWQDEKAILVNQAAMRMFGAPSVDVIIGKSVYEIHPVDAHDKLRARLQYVHETDLIVAPVEYKFIRLDGQMIDVEATGTVIYYKNRPAVLSLYRDISDRKHTEKALRESELKYKTLTENSIAGIFIHQDDKYVYVNEKFAEMHGYSADELIGKNHYDLIHPDQRELIKERAYKRITGEQVPKQYEIKRCHKNGHVVCHEIMVSDPIIYEGNPAIMGHEIDITERKQAEEAMRESEEKYRLLFEMESDVIILIRKKDGQILEVNKAGTSLYGYTREEFLNMKITEISTDPEKTRRAIAEDIERIPIRYSRKKDGTVFPVEISGSWLLWKGENVRISTIRDISDRIDAEKEKAEFEAQLRQVQKMEAIGTLSGGIAHDFNNLLMGIQGNASLMLLDTVPDHLNYEKLKSIERYVQDGADLTKQMLGIARGGKYEITATDLNELIKTSSQMFGRTRKEIRVYTKYQKDIWSVEVDRGQIEQVMLNLYVNAWQAMAGGGDLYLETGNMTLDNRFVQPFGLSAGKYVKVSITDTGIGMDEAIQQRIFDPFFTTKEKGRGTGLGLASAYGIIKNHKGIINVFSKKGEGTTFDIYLPASEKKPKIENIAKEEMLTGDETILLVDDEEIVIDVGRQMLERMGYRLLTAQSGKDTLEMFKGTPEQVDMVILDMIMPDMNGGETYDQLKAFDPNIKVLLSSGYSVEGEAEKILERGCNGFIQKPFKISELSKKVRKILDEAKIPAKN